MPTVTMKSSGSIRPFIVKNALFVNACVIVILISTCQLTEAQIYIQSSKNKSCPSNALHCFENITSFAADDSVEISNRIVFFLEGEHTIDKVGLIVLSNLHNTVLQGIGSLAQGFHETVWQSPVIIRCTNTSGIAFVNSSDISVKFITIENCGGLFLNDVRSHFFSQQFDSQVYYASLAFSGVTNVVIDSISVQNGTGIGLFILSEESDIMLSSSSFTNNRVPQDDDKVGGNIFIAYIDKDFSTTDVKLHTIVVSNTNVSMGSSNGLNGKDIPLCTGLMFYTEQRLHRTEVLFDNVVAYGNQHGSNIAFISGLCATNFGLTINNTLSTRAGSTYAGGGLAIILDWQLIYDGEFSNCSGLSYDATENKAAIDILNSRFIENDADFGAGMVIVTDQYNPLVTLSNVDVSHNTGYDGTAIVLLRLYNRLQTNYWNVSLSDVTINNNSNRSQFSSAAIFANSVAFLKLRNANISDNKCNGIFAVNTIVYIESEGTSVFQRNIAGSSGGGMGLHRGSFLMLENGAKLNFIDNYSRDRGGAIYHSTSLYTISETYCFFQLFAVNSSAHVYLTGNEAELGGDMVFGGSIDDCLEFLPSLNNSAALFNNTFTYSGNHSSNSLISSSPFKVCLCEDNFPNCYMSPKTIEAYPGEVINISLVTVGQRDGVTPGSVLMQKHNTTAVTFQSFHTTGQPDQLGCSNITIEIQSSDTMLEFSVPQVPQYISASVYMNVSIQKCMNGFLLSNTSNSCECSQSIPRNSSTISCNANTGTVTREGNYWIGYDDFNNCTVVDEDCPLDYCVTREVLFSFTETDQQCAFNRTGVLCGSCREGFSLTLGSNRCELCPDSSYVALIIPFAVAGFALVALLMLLNLTVSAGTINGLIFYANILKISETALFSYTSKPVLRQFINWINLDLGFDTCFYQGMTAYGKVGLQFAFPLYIWLIIAIIIFLCHYSTWLSSKIGSNVIQVLATLILLSYTKLFRTIFLVLKSSSLSCDNRSWLVWYKDGNVPYLQTWQHIILFLISLILLLLAVFFTLILIFERLIDKYCTRVKFVQRLWSKFKPLFDAYNGPYKDSCRYWTGLLLFTRLVLLSIAVARFVDKTVLASINTCTLVLLSLFALLKGVYQKQFLNVLEVWSLFNLALVSYFASLAGGLNTYASEGVITATIALVFVTFIGILCYHLFLRLNKSACLSDYLSLSVKKLKMKLTDLFTFKTFKKKHSQSDNTVLLIKANSPTNSEVCLRRETLISEHT